MNQVLLNKLVEVSAGKLTSVVPAPKRIGAMAKQSQSMARQFSLSNFNSVLGNKRGSSVGPKSLNYTNRKNENNRIEMENQKFAQRLYENNSSLKKKNFDLHFLKHEKYKNIVQKVKPVRPQYFGDMADLMNAQTLPHIQQSPHMFMQ